MASFMSLCEGIVPFADFGHTDRILVYPQMQAAIAWSLLAGLIVTALGIVQQRPRYRTIAGRWRFELARAKRLIRRRLPAVWSSDPPVIHPPRRGAGGVSGRVPPRSAVGSTLRRL
jgi:hypothetical protein